MNCANCSAVCIRKGVRNGSQAFRCIACGKYQRAHYRNKGCTPGMDKSLIAHVREGVGIRSTARLLCISPTTVMARIKRIAMRLGAGPIPAGRSYEVDELATYVGRKTNRVWVAYAMDSASKRIVALRIGERSKRNLRPMIDALLGAGAASIRTDGLDIYRALVPATLHSVKRSGTNGIERMNVNLRTHLKRLARRTICYSKCAGMLTACVVLYCWG